jgi:UDP-glucose 4-epimerase
MDSIEKPGQNFTDNVVGTFRLLEACRAAKVRRFINASTGGAILGEAPAPVHEELVPHPLSPYGASKLAAEGYCSAYSASYGLACASLRFSNIYGPRSFHKESVVAHFLKLILAGKDLVVYGDGSQVRDYLYVEDLTDGLVKAITSDCAGVFQLGAGRPTTLNELLEVMKSVVTEERMPRIVYKDARQGEVHTTWCNISRAKETFGYDPSTTLIDGVRATWNWYLQSGQG